jgi:aspartate racemase
LYVREMIAFQPDGPYYIGGYSHGGRVALEMALQLEAMGREVAFLGIIDATPCRLTVGRLSRLTGWLCNLPLWLWYDGRKSSIPANLDRLRRAWRRATVGPAALDDVMNLDRLTAEIKEVYRKDYEASRRYHPGGRCGDVTVFRSRGRPLMGSHEPDLGWGRISTGIVEVRHIAGNHLSILLEPYVDQLAAALREALETAQARAAALLGRAIEDPVDLGSESATDPATWPRLSTT